MGDIQTLQGFSQPTSAGTTAKPSYILRRAKSLAEVNSTTTKVSNPHSQFLLNSLPSSQEMGPVINLKRLSKWVEP